MDWQNMDWVQRQIILGTLLGNGYICNPTSPYLCIQHSVRYKDYLLMKAENLRELGRRSAIYTKNSTIGWRSSPDPVWRDLRQFCYKDATKVVTMEWLDKLHDIAIAVWYCDSGVLAGYKNRNACLRTQAFGKQGNEIICQFFNEVDIPCNINRSRTSYVILFTVRGTQQLFKVVAQHIPEFMHERLLSV